MMHRLPRNLRLLVIGLLGLALLASANPLFAKSRKKILEETLRTYAATIRWGSFEQAESFVDPAWREAHPLTDLDWQRYKQVRVTSYTETAPTPVNDFEVRQTVEIGLVNVNSQQARSIIDRQVWKYDKENKVWLLSTGLPNITRGD